jgi:hypothetical protein
VPDLRSGMAPARRVRSELRLLNQALITPNQEQGHLEAALAQCRSSNLDVATLHCGARWVYSGRHALVGTLGRRGYSTPPDPDTQRFPVKPWI